MLHQKDFTDYRVIQKYAVKLGGGTNHRFNLSDEFLIKDNHIASSDLKELVSLAINKRKKITVEVDNLKQLKRLLVLNLILFCLIIWVLKILSGVKLVKKYYETEASGT